MKTKLFAFMAIVVILSMLVACGSTPAPTKAPAAEPTTGAAPMEVVTIRWRTRPDNQAEQDVYQAISDDLSKQLEAQGIKLQYDPAPVTGYLDKLTTEFSAGNAPDIVWIPGASVADYATKNVLLDLMPLANADSSFNLGDYYDAPMKELQENGHLWGLPRDISTLVLYYNKDLFASKGVDDPADLAAQGKWDWDNFLRVAQELTDPDAKIYGFSMTNWWGPWGYFIYAGGGNMFNADRTACGLDDPRLAGRLAVPAGHLPDAQSGNAARRRRWRGRDRVHRRPGGHDPQRPVDDPGHARERQVQLGRGRDAQRTGRQRHLAVLGAVRRQRQDQVPGPGLDRAQGSDQSPRYRPRSRRWAPTSRPTRPRRRWTPS